jgi:hypothetical protein
MRLSLAAGSRMDKCEEIDLTETVNEIIDALEGMYKERVLIDENREKAELTFLGGLIGAAVQLASENGLSKEAFLNLASHLYTESVRLRLDEMN